MRILCERLVKSPEHLVAIFGPRQTGKTTIVRQALEQIHVGSRYLAVDEPDPPMPGPTSDFDDMEIKHSGVRDADWLMRNWYAARREAERSGEGFVLVLDEIQKLPN